MRSNDDIWQSLPSVPSAQDAIDHGLGDEAVVCIA